MNAVYAIIVLSDTVGTGASIGAPGFRFPHDYAWLEKLRVHYMDKRIFNLAIHNERVDFNRLVDNAFRAAHRFHFPVPRILTADEAILLDLPLTTEMPVMESGFDEPAPAFTPPADPAKEETLLSRAPEAMASHQAKREAHRLGVDLSTVTATGMGGIITKDDVVRTWHIFNGSAAGSPAAAAAGPVSMAELMGAN